MNNRLTLFLAIVQFILFLPFFLLIFRYLCFIMLPYAIIIVCPLLHTIISILYLEMDRIESTQGHPQTNTFESSAVTDKISCIRNTHQHTTPLATTSWQSWKIWQQPNRFCLLGKYILTLASAQSLNHLNLHDWMEHAMRMKDLLTSWRLKVVGVVCYVEAVVQGLLGLFIRVSRRR